MCHDGRVTVEEARTWIDRLYIDAPGAGLRKEDGKKAVELAAIAVEIALALGRLPARGEVTIVDAAAGKGYVGLLAATLCARARRRAGTPRGGPRRCGRRRGRSRRPSRDRSWPATVR